MQPIRTIVTPCHKRCEKKSGGGGNWLLRRRHHGVSCVTSPRRPVAPILIALPVAAASPAIPILPIKKGHTFVWPFLFLVEAEGIGYYRRHIVCLLAYPHLRSLTAPVLAPFPPLGRRRLTFEPTIANNRKAHFRGLFYCWRARQGSNLQPSAPEANALSS